MGVTGKMRFWTWYQRLFPWFVLPFLVWAWILHLGPW